MDIYLAKILVESIKESFRRSRWILSAIAIISLILFSTCWNFYFSWLRSLALNDAWSSTEIVAYLQQHLLKTWVNSGFLSIPIIGIKIHIADAAMIGSIILMTLSLWLFYAMRRNNHLVGRTLRLAKEATIDVQKFVYYGISSSHVFSTISKNDAPIYTLTFKEDDSSVFGVRGILKLSYYLPTIVILFIVTCDILSLTVISSAFRENHVTVAELQLSTSSWVKMYIMEGLAIIIATSNAFLGFRCSKYHDGNILILREFSTILYPKQ